MTSPISSEALLQFVYESIQLAADTGNIRGVYDGIKKAIGPRHSKTAALKLATGETIRQEQTNGEVGGALLRLVRQGEYHLRHHTGSCGARTCLSWRS